MDDFNILVCNKGFVDMETTTLPQISFKGFKSVDPNQPPDCLTLTCPTNITVRSPHAGGTVVTFNATAWAARQAYIALGQFMTSAALLGIDTCPMEGLEPEKYDEVLGLGAQGYQTVVACPAGYRAATDKYAALPKVRFAAKDVITHVS